jgi:peptidoglycan/LPS O-acetylase OafA/YrhL
VLGALSYPLYCIHGVIIQTWNGVGTSPPYLWIFLIGAAWWLNSRIDQPLRQWLLRQWAVARQGLLRTT